MCRVKTDNFAIEQTCVKTWFTCMYLGQFITTGSTHYFDLWQSVLLMKFIDDIIKKVTIATFSWDDRGLQ